MDAYATARMFYGLLGVPYTAFPSVSAAAPHYDDTAIPALPQWVSAPLRGVLLALVRDAASTRPSARDAWRDLATHVFPDLTPGVDVAPAAARALAATSATYPDGAAMLCQRIRRILDLAQ